jgi:N-acetylneuraminic acid mutarotase
MKIAESSQNERIRLRLQFIKPMKAINDVQFDLKPLGETRTEVVWTMSGKNEFMAKAMHAFMNMDRMVGGQFEQGLANLKALAEANAGA